MIEIDGPFYRVSNPGFEMLIPRWEGRDPDPADQAAATITLPDGIRRYATFMIIAAISGIMDRWQGTGECLKGRYFWCSDLVIIRKPGFVSVADAVWDMIAIGELESACSALQIDHPATTVHECACIFPPGGPATTQTSSWPYWTAPARTGSP